VAPDVALSGAAVRDCVQRARDAGYQEMLTSAVGPGEEEPFVAASFTVRERLHLLALDHLEQPAPPGLPIRRAARRDRVAVLALDNVAFDPFWRLGPVGLRDALDATPVRQFRVARAAHRDVVGYAITGYAAGQGYLQRVAVHPSVQREGWGRALVADALVWLWRRSATCAFVNTQLENDAALALYESFGFTMMPAGLAVMGRSL
jgi:ribosomal protein S18 acetylase RimI-like enzyme